MFFLLNIIALAHGLPIIACTGGAVTDTVPRDAGLLTPPDDVEAFAHSLRRLLEDIATRQTMADAAWRHGQALPSWNDTARTVATALSTAMEAAA